MRKNMNQIETFYREIMAAPENRKFSVKNEVLGIIMGTFALGMIFVAIYLLAFLLS